MFVNVFLHAPYTSTMPGTEPYWLLRNTIHLEKMLRNMLLPNFPPVPMVSIRIRGIPGPLLAFCIPDFLEFHFFFWWFVYGWTPARIIISGKHFLVCSLVMLKQVPQTNSLPHCLSETFRGYVLPRIDIRSPVCLTEPPVWRVWFPSCVENGN